MCAQPHIARMNVWREWLFRVCGFLLPPWFSTSFYDELRVSDACIENTSHFTAWWWSIYYIIKYSLLYSELSMQHCDTNKANMVSVCVCVVYEYLHCVLNADAHSSASDITLTWLSRTSRWIKWWWMPIAQSIDGSKNTVFVTGMACMRCAFPWKDKSCRQSPFEHGYRKHPLYTFCSEAIPINNDTKEQKRLTRKQNVRDFKLERALAWIFKSG